MIKKEELGNIYTVTVKGRTYVTTVTEEPSKYKFYKALGLDIFEEKPKKKSTKKKSDLDDSFTESND